MIIFKRKTIFSRIKSKYGSFYDISQEKIPNNLALILLIIIFFILTQLYFSISNNIKSTVYLKNQLKQKNDEIEKMKAQLNNLDKEKMKNHEPKSIEKKHKESSLTTLDIENLYDKNFFKQHNMDSGTSLNKLGYKSLILTHILDKEMGHFDLKTFDLKKLRYLIRLIENESKYKNYKDKFAFINGINSLRQFKNIYEYRNWKDKEEYNIIVDFLKDYKEVTQQKTGTYILTKKEFENDYKIDYLKFIKSRHSTRNYKNEQIKLEDVKAAVEMAKYSPSSSNRQYIKLHFFPSGKLRENVLHYAHKGGLYLEGVNTFIITFDVNGLSTSGERNQGYFNAGIYSTNLINAFHSLGIGTCFIQFSNSVKEEDELKKLNGIPESERIAIILFAGYYDEKSIFAISARKNIKELLIEHK